MERDDKGLILLLAAGLIFAVLLLRLGQLQLVEFSKHRRAAEENAARTIPQPAPRGVIYDRYGRIIVKSHPVFSVQVIPQFFASADEGRREEVFRKLSGLLGERLSAGERERIIIRDHLRPETAARLEERREELPGVTVNVRPLRYYPYGSAAGHLLGYVGEIEASELRRLRPLGYRLGDIIGKTGLEREYDKYLRGQDGGKRIEVDVSGRPVRILNSLSPLPGNDLHLTIDLELQLAAEKALAGKEGAVVVVAVESGELLALTSQPSFNPNVFLDPQERGRWWQLTRGRYPFVNRALSAFPPGSTFKPLVLAAALQEGVVVPGEKFTCNGYYQIGGRIAKCWKSEGHGRLTVEEGIVQSCNIVFYELGRRLGPDRLAAYSRDFGLGRVTRLDLPGERAGLVPDSRWKKEQLREIWHEGESINYGIGQGFLQVTPLQLAMLYGALATGELMKPYLVSEVKEPETGKKIYQAVPEKVREPAIKKEHLALIRAALAEVVDRGTGQAAKVPDWTVAGKTGTAQNPGTPHAWFVAYAPTEKPEIALVVFIAHGGHGDQAAARTAGEVLKWYQQHRTKREGVTEEGEGR